MLPTLVCFFFVASLKCCLGQNLRGESDLSYNFTLAAVNLTEPNANLTGAPLVPGQNGATGGITFYVTSTYSSFPYNDYPSLGLVQNSLRAYTSNGEWNTNATELRSGGNLGWRRTVMYQAPASQIYSAMSLQQHEYPLLAVHGFCDLWSLCPSRYGQTNVVFNVTANIPPPLHLGYDPASCYSVSIQLVPVS